MTFAHCEVSSWNIQTMVLGFQLNKQKTLNTSRVRNVQLPRRSLIIVIWTLIMSKSLPLRTRSFLLNNLLTFTTSYLTINPVVRCVPPVMQSLLKVPRVKTDFGRALSPLLFFKSYTCRHQSISITWLLQTSPQNTLFYFSIIFSQPSDSPAPLT